MTTISTIIISVLLIVNALLSGFNTVQVLQSDEEFGGQTIPGGYVKFTEPVLIGSGTATSTLAGSATSTLLTGITTPFITATGTILTGLLNCDTIDTDDIGTLLCGVDDAGGAASNDLQDAYNSSAADAMILGADTKELIYQIPDTTDPADFIISALSQGDLLINIGSTTNAIWQTYGALGIGTSSPGSALSVIATSTNLGLLTVESVAKAGTVIATSSLSYLGTATSTWPSGGLSVNGGGLASAFGLTISAGDLLMTNGRITLAGVSSSTLPQLTTTSLTATGLTVLGDLNNESTGTSTFAGAISTAGLSSSQGLTLSAGDLLMTNGRITLAGASTSTLPVLDGSTFFDANSLFVSGSGTTTLNGGINAVAGGLRVIAGGLDLQGGDAMFAGAIKVAGTATSTIAGGFSVTGDINTAGILISGSTATSSLEGSLVLDRNLLTKRAAAGGFASTTSYDINWQNGNYQELILDRDITVKFTGAPNPGQVFTLGLWAIGGTGGGDYQIDWDGFTASSSLIWREATSTVGAIEQGKYNLCSFRAIGTSSPATVAVADCSLGYQFK